MKSGNSDVGPRQLNARISNLWSRGEELFREVGPLEARNALQSEATIDRVIRRFVSVFQGIKRIDDTRCPSDVQKRELRRLLSLLVEVSASLVLKKHFHLVQAGKLGSSFLFTTSYGRDVLMLYLLDAAETAGYNKIAYERRAVPIWKLREGWDHADKGYLLRSKTAVTALIRLRERYLYKALKKEWGVAGVEAEKSLVMRGIEEREIEEAPTTEKVKRHTARLIRPTICELVESLNANVSEFGQTIAKVRRQVVDVENHAVEDFGSIHTNNSSDLRRAYAIAERFREGGGSGRITEERNLRADLTWYGVICQLAGKKEVGTAKMLRDVFAPGWGGDLKNFKGLLNECTIPWTRLKPGRPASLGARAKKGVPPLLKGKVI